MDTIIKLMNEFEKRNNISISLTLHSDGSGIVEEFWDREELFQFKNYSDLYENLFTVNYELDENGICYSPVRLKKWKTNQTRPPSRTDCLRRSSSTPSRLLLKTYRQTFM